MWRLPQAEGTSAVTGSLTGALVFIVMLVVATVALRAVLLWAGGVW